MFKKTTESEVTCFTVFIDGLKPECLQYMPFLSSFPTFRRVKTLLGYSIGCHASMYTGVYPNKHHRWFIWKLGQETSPFKWINKWELDSISDNIYYKYLVYLASLFLNKKNTSFTGIPFLGQKPLREWSNYDIEEKKFWDESGYVQKYPSIFEVLQQTGLKFYTLGLEKRNADKSSEKIRDYPFSSPAHWYYLFVGDIDILAHKWGYDSKYSIDYLKRVDRILRNAYRKVRKINNNIRFICYSDHGMEKVEYKINLPSFFRRHNVEIHDFLHYVDSTFARFWVRNRDEKDRILDVLSNLESGFVLSDQDMKKYKTDMPDNRYGDIIYYLDSPFIFTRDKIFMFGRERMGSDKINFMHGYLPEHRDMDGVFVSNAEIKPVRYVNLVDIFPSILALFSISLPNYIDGQVLWS